MADKGWGWPGNSKKAHYFVAGLSLCGKWMFWGSDFRESPPGPDDCRACAKRHGPLSRADEAKKVDDDEAT